MDAAYSAARTVAPAVYEYFVRHERDLRARSEEYIASIPDELTIETIVNAAFWASLRREEGYVPRISLAFLSPAESSHRLTFERPLSLAADALARVAPAVERPGVHLGVWPDGDELRVWGVTRVIPMLCFVLEVAAPGLLVIKHHRGDEDIKFVNVAVLEGDHIRVVDEKASSLPDCPSLVSSLLGFESPAAWLHSPNVLVEIAVSMRAHGRGGLLLVVPAGSDHWRESIARPIPYAVDPPFCDLRNLNLESPDEPRWRFWKEELSRAVETIAGLTAVDGAAVIDSDCRLLAFGAKIVRRKGSPQVEQVTVTEPVEGDMAALAHPEQLGGTRHLSAAQFVHDQQDAVALVASQDGHFTVFAWSPCEAMVHAHRVDALLL